MQNKGILAEILASSDVKLFIKEQSKGDLVALALQFAKKKLPFPLAPVLELLDVYQRGKRKIPTLIEWGWLFTKRAYEQSSSEKSAQWKASQVAGNSLLNLSGGIGVDDWAFASNFSEVSSVDLDPEVHELAVYNLRNTPVERRLLAADTVLQEKKKYDWIYIDPDRRKGSARKFNLEDASPNLIELWPLIKQRCNNILIKASPMVEISEVEELFPEISKIQAVAIKGEVKEILFYAENVNEWENKQAKVGGKSSSQTQRCAVELQGHPSELCLLDSVCIPAPQLEKGQYFAEAHAALNKLNIQKELATRFKAQSLNEPGNYWLMDDVPDTVFCRTFQIHKREPFSTKRFSKYLKEKGIHKANLNRRDFPLSVEELKKRFKIQDGGQDYFFFYRAVENEPAAGLATSAYRPGDLMFIHTRKLHPEI